MKNKIISKEEKKNCIIFYDIDREEFSFWRFFFLLNQSEYHVSVWLVLLLMLAIILLIMVGEKFKDLPQLLALISLGVGAFITIKLERWLMFYEIDEHSGKISKVMHIFGYHIKIYEQDLKNISEFLKIQYEMGYFLRFKNSNKKVTFNYTKKNPRAEIVKYFKEKLNVELKEVVRK